MSVKAPSRFAAATSVNVVLSLDSWRIAWSFTEPDSVSPETPHWKIASAES
jgi:hypothetical protein